MKIVILGAGLSGLSCAYHLKEKVKEKNLLSLSVYERENRVGGLCRSDISKGFIFDYTGHLLHLKNSYVKNLIKSLLRRNLNRIKRKAWIYSKRSYTRYPFQANTYGLSQKVVKECLSGFIEARCKNPRFCRTEAHLRNKNQNINGAYDLQPVHFSSFYDWIIYTFGEGFAKHFMIPYNRKMWTIHPRKMTCEWIGRFIPLPDLREVLMGAITDQCKAFGYNTYFYYPKRGGIQVLSDALSRRIQKYLYFGKEVKEICLSKKLITFVDGERLKYDCLVSTLPLKELILKIIKDVSPNVKTSARALKYNSVLNINLGVDRKDISNKHWIYFPEKKFIFYRVGFPMNFSSFTVPAGTSSIYIEISYRKDRVAIPHLQDKNSIYTSGRIIGKEEMINKIMKDLINARILKKSDKILTTKILNIKHAYVIYDNQYQRTTNIIHRFLKNNNIYSIGRYGAWKYSTMEDAILEGKETADEIIKKIGLYKIT